jgi:hypothetical protein
LAPGAGSTNPRDKSEILRLPIAAGRGVFALPGALARRNGDLLHQRKKNFPHVSPHVFKG